MGYKDPEKNYEYYRLWRLNNPEKEREKHRRYRQANPEKERERKLPVATR